MRYFIEFSYFGKHYHGWQNQPNAITVQQVLELALTTVLRKKIQVVGAGRTDAGVHAKQMFAHFDFDFDEIDDLVGLIQRLNSFLPGDIAVQNIVNVPYEAHARFDATERTYEYWITQKKNPFLTETAHYVRRVLDIEQMNIAATLLLQQSDFECFSKSKTDVNTYRCNITKAVWEKVDGTLIFTICADRFLRNMVRAIVGTLLEVGTGRFLIADVKTILKSGDRRQAGPSVPAKGLYLTKIKYPKTVLKIHG